MNDYPIFWRTMTVAVPTCTAVPLFGLVIGVFVCLFTAVLVVRGIA